MENIYLENFNKLTNFDSICERKNLVSKYSWAIPDNKALKAISNLKQSIVEIGAGTGYWAKLLQDYGVDIVCYDLIPPDDLSKNDWGHKVQYTNVQVGGPEVLTNHSNRSLFLCWPPYDNDMAFKCLNYWKGKYLIYIGEGFGGCTANDDFHQILDKKFNLSETYKIPHYSTVRDKLFIYKRK